MRPPAAAAAAGGAGGNTAADGINVEASKILLVAVRNESGGADSGASSPSDHDHLLSTWSMAAPMVVSSVLSPEPAASTTAELLELPQTIFPEEWDLVDVRETLSVSSDAFPGVTNPEPHGALEERQDNPFGISAEMFGL